MLRHELAAAHWLTHYFRMDDLTWNHISARVEADSPLFLVTPGDKMWALIEPEDLVLSSGNVTANVIHEAIYAGRPDVQAVVHLHTPAAVSVSCLATGLELYDQDGALFGQPGAVAYHDWEGVSDDRDEQQRIASDFGPPPAHTLIMRNHGACTTGSSVGQAWVRAWYLERVCRLQVSLLPAKAAGTVLTPDPEMLRQAAAKLVSSFPAGKYEWKGLMEFYERRGGAR